MRAIAPYSLALVALFAMKDGLIKEAASDIGLGVAVFVYAMLLAGATWRASAREGFVPSQTEFSPIMMMKQQIVTVAAFIFMLSDLLIAWGRFQSSTGLGGHALVMTLYWLAQGLYSASMLRYESSIGLFQAVSSLSFVAIAAFAVIAFAAYGHEAVVQS
jgi:hypothetical protein